MAWSEKTQWVNDFGHLSNLILISVVKHVWITFLSILKLQCYFRLARFFQNWRRIDIILSFPVWVIPVIPENSVFLYILILFIMVWSMYHLKEVTMFLRGANEKIVPISWQSKILNRVTDSFSSESLALSEGVDAGFLVSSLVQDFCICLPYQCSKARLIIFP